MGAGGVALRLLATLVYGLNFCCAAIILGIYSYFLSVLANRNSPITRDQKGIEGLSGVAVLYTIFAICLTCFLGGVRFFAVVAVILDIAFAAAFIALAILLRHGATNCNADPVQTPIGTGRPGDKNGYGNNGFGFGQGETVTYSVTNRTACRLNTAAFAVAIIGVFTFLISAALQIAVMRHHQKEKKYGPSPANNYTSGSGKRKFWQRKPKHNGLGFSDAEVGTAPAAAGLAAPAGAAAANRPSHETGYTGTDSTATKYEHGGYHTAPTGTGVSNPYSYTNAAPINPNLPATSTNY